MSLLSDLPDSAEITISVDERELRKSLQATGVHHLGLSCKHKIEEDGITLMALGGWEPEGLRGAMCEVCRLVQPSTQATCKNCGSIRLTVFPRRMNFSSEAYGVARY
ncbi:hypothetical protein GCM10027040_29800 [Halomonas shantousis]